MSEQHLTEAEDTLDESKFVRFDELAVSALPAVSARRRPADGDRDARRRHLGRSLVPDAARRDRLGQNLHDGQYHRAAGAVRLSCSRRTRRSLRSFTRSSREFFSARNAVEHFVSYYDYYQPEAYVPQRDTVHRERFVDQRAYRADAAVGHQEPDGAARRGDRRDRVGHLRYR